jgi:hypothetical protein
MTSRNRILLTLSALLLLAAPASQAPAQCLAPGPDLSGIWHGDDGGTYRVRMIGNEIFWLGTSPDNGRSWTNVFHGIKDGTDIHGTWADVAGSAHGGGAMTVRVMTNGRMAKAMMTGGFSGSTWTRGGCGDVQLNPDQ